MHKLKYSLIAVLLIVVAAPAVHADGYRSIRPYQGLYVFGDSLSDSGNAFAVAGATQQVYEPIPSLPYDGGRFTNGRTWVEILAKELLVIRGARPALQSRWYGNYAFGGARAVGGETPDFGTQVDLFLQNKRGVAPPNALYVVQFGGNDIRAALEAALAGGDPNQVVNQAIGALAAEIGRLRAAGARTFIVANAPNVGSVPVINAIPGAAAPAGAISAGFNFGLDMLLSNLAASGVEIYRVDFFGFTNAATAMPEGFGFADGTSPCLPVFVPGDVCEDPDQYLFWDGLHPTRAAHRIVGNIAVNQLSLD